MNSDSGDHESGRGRLFKSTWSRLFENRNKNELTAKILEEQQELQEHEANIKLINSFKEKWLGKGLKGKENPFIKEIEENGTINGINVAEIEARMRPGGYKLCEYLLESDKLVDLLRKDQETVNKLGLSHADIVQPLQEIFFAIVGGRRIDGTRPTNYEYRGKIYNLKYESWSMFVFSPFFPKDGAGTKGLDCTSGLVRIKVTNESGHALTFYLLSIHLIRDYGFYGGDPDYRLPPEVIADFFHLSTTNADVNKTET